MLRTGTRIASCRQACYLRRTVKKALVWCPRNSYTFVALKLAWGEARGRECIPSDTRPTEQRSPRPISAQPEGRHAFWTEALLLAPHRSTAGYARRSRLASAQNPLPRMYSYFGDTTLADAPSGSNVICPVVLENRVNVLPHPAGYLFSGGLKVTPTGRMPAAR